MTAGDYLFSEVIIEDTDTPPSGRGRSRPVRCKFRTGYKQSVPSETAADGRRREDGIGGT